MVAARRRMLCRPPRLTACAKELAQAHLPIGEIGEIGEIVKELVTQALSLVEPALLPRTGILQRRRPCRWAGALMDGPWRMVRPHAPPGSIDRLRLVDALRPPCDRC